jgi:hypothetical protein
MVRGVRKYVGRVAQWPGIHCRYLLCESYIPHREIRMCRDPTSQGPSVAFCVINRTSGLLRGELHRLVLGSTCLRGGWVSQPIPRAAQSTPNAHTVRSGPVEMRVVIPGQDTCHHVTGGRGYREDMEGTTGCAGQDIGARFIEDM